MTDTDGNVTDRYAYDAWGKVISHTGTTEQPYHYVGQLGYYTHYQDPELKLLQLGVRFYDSELGRFSQRDPIRSVRFADYAYAIDLPTMHVDASGLAPCKYDPCDPAKGGVCSKCEEELGYDCVKACKKKIRGGTAAVSQCVNNCSNGATKCGIEHCDGQNDFAGLKKCMKKYMP